MFRRTPLVRRVEALALTRRDQSHAAQPVRAFSGKSAGASAAAAASASSSSSTTTTPTTAAASEEGSATAITTSRKLDLSNLVANRKDRDFALSAFFATHRPLVNGEEAKNARQMTREAAEFAAEKGRVEIGRYNDEYAKIFGTFTPYLPPSHHMLYNAMDPAVLPSTHMRSSPSTPFLATGSSPSPNPPQQARNNNNSSGPTIADYLVYKSISKPLPSTLIPPPAPGPTPAQKAAAAAIAAANAAKPLPPSQDDMDVLAAYFANARANCGMTLQQMVDNSGPAYQPGQRAVTAPAPGTTIMKATQSPTVGRVWRTQRSRLYAISILKRRRMKMKKHKWKKGRKAVRDSTRYNRERRRKGGVQREKQE
ncbi:hypothetical protein HDU87_005772 [Geranomyces variabilis]|uniref:Mitochondrial mRNA-processing protein COX24 C-terminal domain-containing protein n=1 Tax=Geranomyces variabilis TaxID=109894 RepID=A0AAD5XQY6_9FUNG|nr:hypothetical protein HDU87_005772 [Geranomyces variabilis]